METRELQEIPVSSVVVTRLQIRKFYDRRKMRELTRSIREEGVMQGIVVRPYGRNKFELVFGSRRLKAARRAKRKTITALIRNNIDDKNVIVIALNENLQRQDLEPFEEALAILRLMKDFKMGVQEVAGKIGRNESFIKRRLKLLKMPKEIQKLVAEKRLSIGHVDMLTSLPVSEQRQVAQEAITSKLSRRELQIHVQDVTGSLPRVKREMAQWTPEKIQLRIKDFRRFVRSVKPLILEEIKPLDVLNIRVALRDLAEELGSTVEEIKKIVKV